MDFVRILTLLMTCCCRAGWADYDYGEFINPFNVDNSLHVVCGNKTHRQMTILYRGDAISVYLPDYPECIATEVEPGHFLLDNLLTSKTCGAQRLRFADILSAEVSVQRAYVRRDTDDLFLVICAYEIFGSVQAEVRSVNRPELLKMVQEGEIYNKTQPNQALLTVHDGSHKEVRQVHIGSKIQLRLSLTPEGNQVSFEPTRCSAASTTNTSEWIEHPILIDGCGDGDILPKNRGFRVRPIGHQDEDPDKTGNDSDTGSALTRQAVSAFFDAFLIEDGAPLMFICHYVVCYDDSCDGLTCEEKRSRRRASTGRQPNDDNDSGDELVSFRSLWVIKPEETHHLADRPDMNGKDGPWQPAIVTSPDDAERVLPPSALFIGLPIAAAFLAVVAALVAVSGLYVWRRGRRNRDTANGGGRKRRAGGKVARSKPPLSLS